ncbi:MAG: hypothetical protein WAT19_01520 [Ferruginibacter sp.]
MLSETELAKVTDREWILTKQVITDKAVQLFNMQVPVITELFQPRLQSCPFPELLSAAPKISKGENYLGLPWVMLDYPAVFSKEHVFAVRTMFWWGNFVSITLHLGGKYKNLAGENADEYFRQSGEGLFLCINEDQWHHHFEPGNYREASGISLHGLMERPFIKVALKYDLQDWNQLQSLLHGGYTKLAGLLK